MTEDEAKTKWCCGAPAVAHATYWKGGADVGDTPALCIASACMAWRWQQSPDWVTSATQEAPMAHAQKPFTASGHCGLAGT